MRRYIACTLLAAAGIWAAAVPVFPQAGNARPSFDVASIKPNNSGINRIGIGAPGGTFNGTNVTLRLLVRFAYRVQDFQILGGPKWMDTDHFDIQAKPEGGARQIPPEQMSLMVQSLLEDRFQLKLHRETRELPTYTLVVAKDGPKIKSSPDQTPPAPPQPGERGAGPRGEAVAGPRGGPEGLRGAFGGTPPRGAFGMGRGSMMASAVPLSTLINVLSQQLGRPIIDKTDLKGLFDIQLQWTPDVGQAGGPFGAFAPGGPEPPPPPVDASGPSIFTALQEQLGLRLESTKGPVEVLVIDSVQPPSEN
ncbi:MAG TPA: TIGR03435 family protein [Terriglobia bacterium]|nr:TIGR03435 family protein [Terriglobia bacterium]